METNQNSITEKQKMLNGEFYNAFEKELLEDRKRAKNLCKKLNDIPDGSPGERSKIIKDLLHTNKEIWIESPFRCDYGYNIAIGDNFYANFGCVILDCNLVKIGDNVKFGPNVQIYTATHPIDTKKGFQVKKWPILLPLVIMFGSGEVLLFFLE